MNQAMKWTIAGVIVLAIMTLGMYMASQGENTGGNEKVGEENSVAAGPQVVIQTDKGTIVIELYPELLPTTVNNFIGLVEEGFYNGLVFHRVEPWVIQTGDPTGTGSGGSEQTIPLETHPDLSNVRGAVGMARSMDPNSASSQFYILTQDALSLDGQYSIFGKVVEGMEVVDQIQLGDQMNSAEMK
jgi:peptidyl-prolyl cis-trans isomerase B (cyclophilin B)